MIKSEHFFGFIFLPSEVLDLVSVGSFGKAVVEEELKMWIAIFEKFAHVIQSKDEACNVCFFAKHGKLDQNVSETFILVVDALVLDRHVSFAVTIFAFLHFFLILT